MKKLLVSMLVALLCVPAIAAVDVTLEDNADGSFDILLNTNGEAVRGIALKIEYTGDGGLDLAGSSIPTGDDEQFNTCIDYAFNGTATYDVSMEGQHPFATDGAAGVAAGGETTFVVSLGYLDQDGGQAAWSSTEATVVATVQVGAGVVCVTEDTLRGGIVGDAEITVNLPECLTLDGTQTCADLYAANALYGRYTTAGTEPVAWCWQYQCYGDADNGTEDVFIEGTYRIYDADLTLLINNWKKTPETGANPVADFDHAEEDVFIEGSYSIYDGDLTLLINNWKKADGELTDCPNYLP